MGDDFDLLRAWQSGDANAGDRLARKHFVSVYRFFASKFPTSAEDLTQKTFLRSTERLERIDAERGFKGYLFGIARHVLSDYLRKHYRQPVEALMAKPAAELDSAETLVANNEQEGVILRAMRALPLQFQAALELHYWESMELKEIAAAQGVAEGTVKSRLARGRQMLEARIQKMAIRGELREATLRDLAGWSRSLGAFLARTPTPPA